MPYFRRTLVAALLGTLSFAAQAAETLPPPVLVRCYAYTPGPGIGLPKPPGWGLSSSSFDSLDPIKGPKLQMARDSLASASVIVLGRYDSYEAGGWLNQLRADSKFYETDVDFTAATAFLRKCLTTYAGNQAQLDTINAAFWQARGRLATPKERNAYLPEVAAGKAWYATIVLAEKQKVADAGTPAPVVPPGGFPKLPAQSLPVTPKP